MGSSEAATVAKITSAAPFFSASGKLILSCYARRDKSSWQSYFTKVTYNSSALQQIHLSNRGRTEQKN